MRGARLAELLRVEAEEFSGLPGREEAFGARIASTPRERPTLTIRRRLARACVRAVPRVVVLVLLAWGLFFNFSEVSGSSMEPGIHDQDRILVDHVRYLVHQVERGDIVILRYPLDPSVDYIKRVIGLPGDEIVLAGGKVWVNGRLLREPYVDATAIDSYTHTRVIVEPDHYFVLGDNRMRSSDSREFGQVAHELLRGKVQVCVWPPWRLGWIE